MHIRKRYTVSYDEWKKNLHRQTQRTILIVVGSWLVSAGIILWLFRG